MKSIKDDYKSFFHVDYIISAICLIVLVLLTVLGVIRRYIFNNPITWLEEIQAMMITWAVFFGGSVAFRHRAHISIEIIVDSLPKKIQKLVHILIYVVTILILVYMTVQGFNYIMGLQKIGRVTSVLQIPSQYIYMAFPLGALLMLINFVVAEGKALLGKQTQEEGEEN